MGGTPLSHLADVVLCLIEIEPWSDGCDEDIG